MAREDLYKTARQSAKLFKLVQEGQELESWVSKKITKAAADIESVYQYLNFEKHFNEQEKAIMSNTSISEATREELRGKLLEAKAKVAAMKKKAAKEKSEKMDENAFDYKNKGEMKVGDKKKTRTGELEKTATGVKHTNTSFKDEEHGEANTTHAKARSAAEKKSDAPHQKKSKTGTWGMEGGSKFDNRKVSEAKAKCCCEEKGKAKCPVHGKMDEAQERTMSKAAKGVMKYGKEGMQALAKAGKEGKSLDKVRAKYDKYDESTVSEAKKAKPDFLDMDKDGNKKESMKKAVADKNKAKIRESIARAKALLEAGKKKPKWLEKAEVEAEEKEGKKVSKAEEKKVGIVKESTELDRLKFLTKQLNG